MSERPSWQTSTLSQAFFLACLFYASIIILVSVGLIWFNLDIEKAKLIIGWSSAFQVAISSAYLTARNGNGNGTRKEEPPKP